MHGKLQLWRHQHASDLAVYGNALILGLYIYIYIYIYTHSAAGPSNDWRMDALSRGPHTVYQQQLIDNSIRLFGDEDRPYLAMDPHTNERYVRLSTEHCVVLSVTRHYVGKSSQYNGQANNAVNNDSNRWTMTGKNQWSIVISLSSTTYCLACIVLHCSRVINQINQGWPLSSCRYHRFYRHRAPTASSIPRWIHGSFREQHDDDAVCFHRVELMDAALI